MKDTDFFLKLNVPNLLEMQAEVLDYLKNHPEHDKSGILDRETWTRLPNECFPTIFSFVSNRSKNRIYEIAVRTVPPGFTTDIHVDGVKKDPDLFYTNQIKQSIQNQPDRSFDDINWDNYPYNSQYVLIIPISNYENTINYWYDPTNDSDKEITHYYERKEFPFKFFINFYKGSDGPIKEIIIDKPTFIKSNIYHNVKNYGTKTRIVVTVRILEYEKYSSLNQYFNYDGLV